jgi:hypothetical protein
MVSRSKQGMFNIHIGLDQPAVYVIKIQGRLAAKGGLNDSLADWFLGETRRAYEPGAEGGVTSLTGTLADQAALHGLLSHIRNLGLTLLYVDCLSAHEVVRSKE